MWMGLFLFFAEIETVLRFERFCYERIHGFSAKVCFSLQNLTFSLGNLINYTFIVCLFVCFTTHSITA